ncbi:MAG: hypothetical protein U5L75_00305 [Candidatus Campbellbacteria bacterium]|nr:hypothetical protein [Candidatus Campbellbacteria bacterium]
MLERIKKIRKKSRGERMRITFLSSLALTSIVGLVWATAVLPRTIDLNSEDTSQADSITPFKALGQDFDVVRKDLKQGVGELNTSINELIKVFREANSEEDLSTEVKESGSRGNLEGGGSLKIDEESGEVYQESEDSDEEEVEVSENEENNEESSSDSDSTNSSEEDTESEEQVPPAE